MKRTSSALAAVMFLGCYLPATAAQSEVFDGRFYVAPQVSYGFFDEADGVSLDDDEGFGIAIGKPLSKKFNLEAYYFQFDGTDIRGSGGAEADQNGYGLTGLFFPVPDSLPLFLLAGYSVGDFEVDANNFDEDVQHIDAGIGFLQEITDYGIAVRGEYRFRNSDVDTIEDNFDNHIVSLGLQIPLGTPPAEPAPEPEPAPAPPPQPKDSDNDGVIDARDQCPGTPAGTKVDQDGCPVEKAAPIVLKGVRFEFDSAKLTAQAENRLDNVVNALQGSKQINVRVEGHTDSIGSAEYNRDLSQRRSDSVKRYLVNHGIAPSRMTTRGFGESRPVATNETKAGRAKNRRVELHVKDE